MNGAAYGKGIYLSPNAGTSFGYSRMYGGGSKKAEVRSNSYIVIKIKLKNYTIISLFSLYSVIGMLPYLRLYDNPIVYIV